MASKKPKPRTAKFSQTGRDLPRADEIEAYMESIEKLDGRAAALSQAAFLEAQLERAIALNFFLHSATHYEDLFIRAGAPLATISAKIIVAAALGILNANQRSMFDTIRAVRNVFAHSVKMIGFDTPAVDEACLKLDPQTLLSIGQTYQGENNNARERFRVSGMLISNHLMAYMQSNVASRKAAGMWREPKQD